MKSSNENVLLANMSGRIVIKTYKIGKPITILKIGIWIKIAKEALIKSVFVSEFLIFKSITYEIVILANASQRQSICVCGGIWIPSADYKCQINLQMFIDIPKAEP